MKRKIIALFGLCCAVGFGAETAGRYALRGVMEVGSELLLKPDGTFEYQFIYGAADYQANGRWRTDGDYVVLDTAGAEEPPFRVTSSKPAGTNGTKIWVRSAQGAGIQHIEVRVQTSAGEADGRTGQDGLAEFTGLRGARSLKLHVPVYDVEGGPYELNPAHSEFFVEINGDAITRVPFKSERLKIVNGNLEMRFWNKERPMTYRRQ